MTHRLDQSLVYAGVYDGHLNVYDTRKNNNQNSTPVHSERVTQRGYIFALELQDPYILVMHKSTTLCLYDQRTWQKIENVPVCHRNRCFLFEIYQNRMKSISLTFSFFSFFLF